VYDMLLTTKAIPGGADRAAPDPSEAPSPAGRRATVRIRRLRILE
jgi:hypothetical protein